MNEPKWPEWVANRLSEEIASEHAIAKWTWYTARPMKAWLDGADYGVQLLMDRVRKTREADFPIAREGCKCKHCGELKMQNAVREALRKEILGEP